MVALVQVTAPAMEPLTIAEVLAQLLIDEGGQEPAPNAPTASMASPAAAGNVDNGAHRYLVVFKTAFGNTQAGVPSAAVTVADKTVNGQIAVTGIPLGGSSVTARDLYRTKAGGDVYYLLGIITDNTTVGYTDNIADSALGAGSSAGACSANRRLRFF